MTTRWLQPWARCLLRTAYVDAVAVWPEHQGGGIGSSVMHHLATVIDDHQIACLETDRPYLRASWVGGVVWMTN